MFNVMQCIHTKSHTISMLHNHTSGQHSMDTSYNGMHRITPPLSKLHWKRFFSSSKSLPVSSWNMKSYGDIFLTAEIFFLSSISFCTFLNLILWRCGLVGKAKTIFAEEDIVFSLSSQQSSVGDCATSLITWSSSSCLSSVELRLACRRFLRM